MSQFRTILLAALLCLCAASADAKPARKPAAAPPKPQTEAEMIQAARLEADHLGYVVFDAATGRRLASRNVDEPFIPASVAKVPMAVAALGILGPDHQFETGLYATGGVAGPILKGDLYLRGGGDPYLMTEDLAAFVQALRGRGITRVNGRFFYDALWLADAEQIDPVQPDAAQYNPGLSALSLNFNRIAFAWDRSLEPPSLLAYSESRHGSLGVDGIVFGPSPALLAPGVVLVRPGGQTGEAWAFSPQLEKSGRTWLPLRRPAPIAAQIFRTLAAAEGIELPATQPGRTPDAAEKLWSSLSPPLSELVRTTLRFSNNMGAELIGLAAARRLVGRPQSLDQASHTVSQWLKEQIPGADWKGFNLANFSGLSSESRVSPAQLAAILAFAAKQRYGFEDFYSLLPAKPWDLDDDDTKGRKDAGPPVELHAKTGTVAYGCGLAGFIDKIDRRLGFVVFVSDSDARQAFDASNQVRVLTLPREAKAWLRRSRNLERSLVVKWANGL